MTRATLRGVGRGLVPADEASRAALLQAMVGGTVTVEVLTGAKGRSLQQLGLWWSMCGMIAEAVGEDERGNTLTRNNVSDIIKIKSGHCDILEIDGETFRVPKSIAFDAVPAAQFNEIMNAATKVVCEQWLPHMKPSKLRQTIEQMLIGTGP